MSFRARADDITERWHAALRERLRVRPQNVFPTEELLDGAPAVVNWLARSVRNGDDLGTENTESLREMAAHWRKAGEPGDTLPSVRVPGEPLQLILHDLIDNAVKRCRRGKESRGDGFGLGLAIVRETARQFGGRILLESEPGVGSTFSVTIPAEHIRE